MKKSVSLLIVLAILLAPTLAFAGSPWTEKTTYAEQVNGKLAFGAKNLLLGWTDLFYQPHAAQKDGKNPWGALGKALFTAPLITVGGAVHFVTFPIPVDVPLPHGGVQLDK
jgi:hypothetical protein